MTADIVRQRLPHPSPPPSGAPALAFNDGASLGATWEEGGVIAPLPVWFVAFVETSAPVWWQRLLKPGFRHCLAFAWDHTAGRWLVLNPLFDAVVLRALDDDGFAGFLADLKARRPRIVLARAGVARVARPRLLMTCVSAIAAILGLRLCALTPYALYRTLVRHGAKPIHPEPVHR